MAMMSSDRIKAFIGDLARPFAIYVTSGAAAVAVVKIAAALADKSSDFSAAAIFITAVLGGVAGIYWGKAWENSRVKVAEAQASPPTPAPGTANIQAAPDVTVAATVTSTEDDDPELDAFREPKP